MGYRKTTPSILPFQVLMEECGLLTWDDEGFIGCKSKSKHKQSIGKCAEWDCPLSYSANLADMKELDEYLYKEYKDEEFEPSEMCSGWVVQYREIV